MFYPALKVNRSKSHKRQKNSEKYDFFNFFEKLGFFLGGVILGRVMLDARRKKVQIIKVVYYGRVTLKKMYFSSCGYDVY